MFPRFSDYLSDYRKVMKTMRMSSNQGAYYHPKRSQKIKNKRGKTK